MKTFRHALWWVGFLAVLAPLPAAEYAGDSLTLLVPDGASYRQVKVRLAKINTPESKQPYGERANQVL